MLLARHLALSGTINGGPLARAPYHLRLALRARYSTAVAAVAQDETTDHDGQNNSDAGRGRRLPGWRAKRYSYSQTSPTDSIAEYISSTNQDELNSVTWEKIRAVARNRTLRLPVMTAQMLWRQDEKDGKLRRDMLSKHLPYGANWHRRVDSLSKSGLTGKHLASWVFILKGGTPDARLARFLGEWNRDDFQQYTELIVDTEYHGSSELVSFPLHADERTAVENPQSAAVSWRLHRPIFLLFLLVRSDQIIHDRQLFLFLVEYIKKTYAGPPSTDHAPPNPKGKMRAMTDSANLTPKLFLVLLSRLRFHTSRLCPESMVDLAELVTAYLESRFVIDTADKEDTGLDPGFAARCSVLNGALRLLSTPAESRPYANMEHNWDAQRHLLAFSSSLKRPLIINRSGYRAIQSVMIGRKKSPGEEKVAIRSARSWPPYRQAWDGIDERRRPEDDLSRAVKAGIQAREAGYPETEYDRALSALGGAIFGESPTVQTRSQPPKPRTGNHAAEAILSTWAARIKATRNAQEAWARFRTPPERGLKPSAAVYAEMMAKIVASEVADPSSTVPGNSRENFPVHQSPNLTEFEKARIRSPTMEKLAEEMVANGIRPVGQVLCLLIKHSNSEKEMLHWLGLSPYGWAVDALNPSLNRLDRNLEKLDKVPLTVFNAYISFLCKLQVKEEATADSELSARARDHYLQTAMDLIPARLRPTTAEGRSYKPPWLQVLHLLIMSKSHSSFRHQATRRKRVQMFLNTFKWVAHQTGMDTSLLSLLCLSTGRVMAATFTGAKRDRHSITPSWTNEPDGWWSDAESVHLDRGSKACLQGLQAELTKAFADIKRSGSGISGFHVYAYMRAVGLFGDVNQMASVLDYALKGLENGSTLDDAVTPGTSSNAYLNLAFALFEKFAMEKVSAHVATSIAARRQALADQGYPLEVPALSGRDLDDMALVSTVAKGWAIQAVWEIRR